MSPGYRVGWRWLPMGALLGAVAGAAVGAASTAVVLLPPVVLVAMLSALSRDPSMLVDVIRHPLDGYLLLAASALGGPLAARAAGKDVRPPQPDVS